MGTEVLLNPADPVFAFHHAMSHRTYYQAMGPLHQWTILPYLLDPTYALLLPGSEWHLNHQQAHNDFTRTVPSGYENPGVGIPTNQNLLNPDLADARSRAWWTFANHQEHYIADDTMLPLPNTVDQTGAPASAPWWIPAPRWTPPPYW